jgi:tetratricopeptide (TPR) repeat protein
MAYAYDVFVSYSHQDADWVQGQLVPRLKAAGLMVCIDVESFRLGAPLLTEMERAVDASRKTVLVLTPTYLKSAWTEFETLLLQTPDPTNRMLRLLPILRLRCKPPARIAILNRLDFTGLGPHDTEFAKLIAAIQEQAPPETPQPPQPAFNLAPRLPDYYVAREDDLQRLRDRLQQGGVLGLTAVHGMGGVGKSVLAAALAHDSQAQTCFADGVLWATLGPGAGGPADADAHLLAWGVALGVGDDMRSLPTVEARAAALRAHLAGRHCLLVIDDVWAAGQAAAKALCDVRGDGCCVLLTTRDEGLAATLDAQTVRVDVLAPEEALDLLQKRVGRSFQGDELAQVQELAQRVGFLPLALALAAAQVKLGRAWLDLLQPLRAQQPAAGELDFADQHTRETSLSISFDLSYDALDAADRRRYRWLGALAAQAPFRVWDAAQLWQEEETVAAKALQRLAQRALLEHIEGAPEGRYRQHLLLRDDARRRMDEAERAQAFGRHATVYLNLAQAAVQSHDYHPVDPAYAQLLAVLRRARRGYTDEPGPALGPPQEARRVLGDLVFALTEYWSLRGLVREWLQWGQAAVACCRALSDRENEGEHMGNLGLAYADLGRMDEAIAHYQQALAIHRESGDRRAEGNALGNLGEAYRNLGRLDEAIAHYQQALAIARQIGDRRGEGNRLANLGNAYSHLGRMDEAIAHYQQALAIARDIGNRRVEGIALGNLGLAYAGLGRMDEAIAHYQQALAIARQIGDQRTEGTFLGNLGSAYLQTGRMDEAITHYQQALAIHREIGNRDGEAIGLYNLGDALFKTDAPRGVECVHQALAIFEAIRSPHAQQAREWLAQHGTGNS